MASLATLGATSEAQWFTWPTVTAALEGCVLMASSDPEPAQDDMDALACLVELTGFDNGTDGPFRGDIGEPRHDMLTDTWTWKLAVPAMAA